MELTTTNQMIDCLSEERGKLADKAARLTIDALQADNEDFIFEAGFNYSKIIIDKERYIFARETKNIYLLGLGNKIRKEVKNKVLDINKLKNIEKYLKVPNNYIYKPKRNKYWIDAYEYDLNAAYPSVLRVLFLSQSTYERILELKYKYGFNVNQSIGGALLGSKLIKTYKNGQPNETQAKINELRPVFMLIRYLIISTLRKLLGSEEYIEHRVCFYVDAIILINKVNIKELATNFGWYFLDVYLKLNELIKKHEGFELTDIFDMDPLTFDCYNYFSFKEKYIKSLTINRNEFNGLYKVEFYRENQLVTYKTSV